MTLGTAARPSSSTTASRRRRLAAALVSGALALSGTVAAAGTAAADGKDHVVSVPVEFHVQVPDLVTQGCLGTSVAGPATLRGTITGPKESLEKPATVGSVLSHGDGYDESFWTFPEKGYDVADDLAQHGHVSVSYDRLGYGDSDKPNGNGICYATEAAVLKQAIDQLRAGTYTTKDEKTKPKFTRVGLFGHSASGFIVEYLAGNLGGIDALGAISTGLTGAQPLVFQRALEQQARCKLTGPNPNGYAGLEADDAQFASDHLNTGIDPKIAAILTRNRTKDACAGTLNIQNIVQNELATNARIRVPVLVVAGANDMFFPNAAGHAATFPNAPKTVQVIPDTPHAIAFSGRRQLFRDTLDAFLRANAL